MKCKLILIYLLLSLNLTGGFSESASQLGIDSYLVAADEIRRIDDVLFNQKLIDLESQIDVMSAEQRHYYFYLKAYSELKKGVPERAETFLNQIYQSSTDLDLLYRCDLLMANVKSISRDFTNALSYLSKSLENISTQSLKNQQTAYGVAAVFYNQLGQYDIALTYASRMREIADDDTSQCTAHQQFIEANLNLSNSQFEEKVITDGIRYCDQAGDTLIKQLINYNYAKYRYSKNDIKGTLELLRKNINEVKATNYQLLIAAYYSLFAKALYDNNDLTSAQSFANKSLEMSDSAGNVRPLIRTYEVLYHIARQRGDFPKAIEYLEKFKSTENAYIDDVKAKTLAFQLAKQEVAEKNNQIALLNKQNEVLTLEQNLAKEDAQNKTLTISILVLIVVFISLWAYRTKQTHIKLRQLAEFDSLTGIANRRHFTKQAEVSLKANQANDQAVCFILFDLDKFKSINDTFGHPVGDWVLRNVPEPVKKIIRKVDIFGRMGGEEFAILLPGCELEKAREIAEQIRKALMSIATKETGHDFQITASFGVTVSRVSGYDIDNMMKHSDDALYHAKHAGRNQVSIYSMPPSEVKQLSESND